MRQFDWPITENKKKLWRHPKIEDFILKYRGPSLWPTSIGEKEDNICQSIRDKSEVLLQTLWGNMSRA
jgi:hypothetical protein